MKRALIPVLVSTLLVFAGVGLFSCGSDDSDKPTEPTTPTGPNWPADAIALPDEDAAAMDTACAMYLGLLDALDPIAARQALVDTLTLAVGEIKRAVLGSDSTTVSIDFEDGATALLITDEVFAQDTGSVPPPKLTGEVLGERSRQLAGGLSRAIDCGNLVMPESHKVLIVNMAGGTNPEFNRMIDWTKESLVQMGWGDDEVDIRARLSFDDKSFLPDSLLSAQQYGLALYAGHGGVWIGNDGIEHYHMQCFRGGKYETGYAPYVTEERWEDYKRWYRQEHRLISAYCLRPADSSMVREVWIREDLFCEQLQIASGAMVSVTSCNSWQITDDLAASQDVGSIMAWDGKTNFYHGELYFVNFIDNMIAAETRNDVEAVAKLIDDGGGTWVDSHGGNAIYRAANIDGDFYLPGWGTVAAAVDDFPVGTSRIDVTITHDECTDQVTTRSLTPGETVDVDGLVPGEATVRIVARDGSNNTLGAGSVTEGIRSGVNSIDVATCDADLLVTVTDYPQEVDGTVDNIEYILRYDDETVDSVAGDFTPSTGLVAEDLMPLKAVLASTAYDGGTVLATSTDSLNLLCDSNDEDICFGWLVFSAGDVVEGTENILVTVDSGGAHAPDSVMFAHDSECNMFGFETGETVLLTARAVDVHGVVQGSTGLVATIGCGENPVEIDISVYAVLLEVSPKRVNPDGTSYATVTATLKTWMPGDLLEPTGDPVPGKLVEFDASCGSLSASSGISDADGQVTVQVISDQPCLSEVHAFVMADLAESSAEYVNFGSKMSFWLNGSDADITGSTTQGAFDVSCVTVRFYWRGQLVQEFDRASGEYWGTYCPGWNEPGDEVRLELTANGGINGCSGQPSTYGPIYLHVLYEDDFDHQDIYQLTAGSSGFTGTVILSVEPEEIDYYR